MTEASPLEPAPSTSLEYIFSEPEPVDTPTPEEMLTSPPRPLDEELDPALIWTDPPLPAADGPTLSDMLPAEPPLEVPVDTRTDPDGPALLDPLPRERVPVAPAPDPLPRVTEPLAPEVDEPDSKLRPPEGPDVDTPECNSTPPED